MDDSRPALGTVLWVVLLATLGFVASQPLGAESLCTARPLAKYSLTFTGKWSQTAFPKQYPLFRPPAQWSSLLGKGNPHASARSQVPTDGRLPAPSAQHDALQLGDSQLKCHVQKGRVARSPQERLAEHFPPRQLPRQGVATGGPYPCPCRRGSQL